LRKDRECKVVGLLNTRKRYNVKESLDLTRNTPWLASHFSKIKKPNKSVSQKLFIGNQSVIAGFWILTLMQLQLNQCFVDFDDKLARATIPI
jgi:hypothetical protein